MSASPPHIKRVCVLARCVLARVVVCLGHWCEAGRQGNVGSK